MAMRSGLLHCMPRVVLVNGVAGLAVVALMSVDAVVPYLSLV